MIYRPGNLCIHCGSGPEKHTGLDLQCPVGVATRHCSTCQCNKLNAEVPSPGNPQSKSWHTTAGGKP